MARSIHYSTSQIAGLTILRILIGWHFLFEGTVKLLNPVWTAKEYLVNANGPFHKFFHFLASNDSLLSIVDFMNIWGLLLIGISLILGLFVRYSTIGAIVLLFMYYIAYPPFSVLSVAVPMEGSYWIVNKTLIELAATYILHVFQASHITGLDCLIFKMKVK